MMSINYLRIAIAQHNDFISRTKKMISFSESNSKIPDEYKFTENELMQFKNFLKDMIINELSELPPENVWIDPVDYSYRYYDYHDPSGWLKTFRKGLEISNLFLNSLSDKNEKDNIHYGDVITVTQSNNVALKSNGNYFSISENAGNVNIDQLSSELATLRAELLMAIINMKDASAEHYKSLSLIASAEEAVKNSDITRAKEYLKGVMTWCVDVSTKIGVNVATEFIKSSMQVR